MNLADEKVRDLSRANQEKSSKTIKTEELCFRSKLKMMTFLQKMHLNLE